MAEAEEEAIVVDDNGIPFPRPQRWSATRLAALNRSLDAFDAEARAILGIHPEHDDGDHRSDRVPMLCLAIDGEVSAWFWPEDLRREFYGLLERLGLTMAGQSVRK